MSPSIFAPSSRFAIFASTTITGCFQHSPHAEPCHRTLCVSHCILVFKFLTLEFQIHFRFFFFTDFTVSVYVTGWYPFCSNSSPMIESYDRLHQNRFMSLYTLDFVAFFRVPCHSTSASVTSRSTTGAS